MYRIVSFVVIAGLSTLANIPTAAAQGTAMRQSTTQQSAPRPPVGCPEGYKPRPPELNPALGPCIPATITARPEVSIAPEPPVGCPEGFKPRPPELNPALGPCIPGSYSAQPSRELQASGRPDTDPIQKIQVPPQEGGRPETDPIQRLHAPVHLLKPDLALIGSFQLGNIAIPWGNSANLADSAASTQAGGTCRFRYKYATRNQGNGGAMATSNQITRDAQAGPLLAGNPLPALGPGAAASSSGHLSLTPGTWMIYVFADQPLLVAESDETNNLRRVRVTVTGDCKP